MVPVIPDIPSTEVPAPAPLIAAETSRRSSRRCRPPLWLQYFVTQPKGNACAYPLTDQLTYSHLSPYHRQVLQAYSTLCELVSFKEAVVDPSWVKAMELEIIALESNNTWSIVGFPPGKKLIEVNL